MVRGIMLTQARLENVVREVQNLLGTVDSLKMILWIGDITQEAALT